MQTFLPIDSAGASAQLLDRQRLGKQRVEAWQILQTLSGVSRGWANHPAVKMWRGHEAALALYGLVMCEEWIRRGYKDTMSVRFSSLCVEREIILPSWVGDEAFHRSHQSNLVRKFPAHYRTFFPDVPDNLPYVWPEGRA